MYKPQSLQSLVHALMSARGSRLVKKRGCLEYDQDRLNVSDKNLVHLKNWKSPSKQIEKAPVGVSFAGPPNHPFVSSCHVHPEHHDDDGDDNESDDAKASDNSFSNTWYV